MKKIFLILAIFVSSIAAIYVACNVDGEICAISSGTSDAEVKSNCVPAKYTLYPNKKSNYK